MSSPCRRAWDALEAGAALDAELQAHAATCPGCRPALLLSRLRPPAQSGAPAGTGPSAFARAELLKHPRAVPWWVGAAVLFGLTLACGLGSLFLLSPGHVVANVAPRPALFALALCLTAVTGLASAAALSPWTALRRALWPLAAAGGLLVLLGGSGFNPGGALLRGALMCGTFELGTALVPFAVTLFLLTRFFARPGQALAGGLAATGGGLLALHLHCPNGTPPHLLLGHILPALGAGLVAWAIRSRLPSRSFAP